MVINKKRLSLLLCLLNLLAFAGAAFAGQVSEATAWQVAQNLMTNHVAVHSSWNGNPTPHPKSIEVVKYKGEPVAYLVTAYPSGHLLVAYYDDFSPVLFYSPSATLDPSKTDDPNAIESWIIPEIYSIIRHINGKVPVVDKKTKRTFFLDSSNARSTEAGAMIETSWKMLNAPSKSFNAPGLSSASRKADAPMQTIFASSIGPLLSTTWDQGDPNDSYSPYNEYTPAAPGCTHTVTGCVAAAMAQVMKYWNWPDTGTGSYSYTVQGINSAALNGTILSADFSHAYNWSSMPDALTSYSTSTQDDAVARLMSDVGISVSMEYGCGDSGAMILTVPGSMSTYFKYQPANIVARADYSLSSDWMDLIETELNAATPRVILFGIATGNTPADSGHMVVIDGYQTSVSGTGQVHLNYGWGGFSDGYYDITSNWTTGGYTWDVNDQGLVVGIEPLSESNNSHMLTILKSGTGSGSVSASTGTINWNANLGTTTYASNTSVSLTVAADPGSTFSGWTGCDSVSGGTCMVTISTNKMLTVTFSSAQTNSVIINEFTVPTANSSPYNISAGPDGNVWFIESNGNKIGRITTTGVITEFPIPTASSNPDGITAGPDNNLWFTEYYGNKIGRITTAGVITEFAVPTDNSEPRHITTGPDGNLWFTENVGNKIGRITTAGAITEFTVPTTECGPDNSTAGRDGNIWFTENIGNKIGRITTTGVITEFPIPTASSNPIGIVSGPDGNLWFTETAGNKIGQITTAGVITEFTVPTASSKPEHIAAGPDGSLWFTETAGNKIGRITTVGVITEFTVPTASSGPNGIDAGPDGNIWLSESYGNKIGQILLDTVRPSDSWTLSVSKTGTGSGTVTADSGTISWIGNTGTASYSAGTTVTLAATPSSGSTFTGWSGGGCSGTGTCSVTMNAATSIVAMFNNSSSTCTYTLSPNSQIYMANGGTGTVSVGASSTMCSWTASSNVSWITVDAGSSHMGNGTISYSLSANTGTSSRVGTMTIAGHIVTITQTSTTSPNVNPAIAAGLYHTAGLRSDGTVWAWGDNAYGQLGDGTTTQRNTPVQVSGLSSVTAIAAGEYHTVALESDGTVWAWGYNVWGELGDGTATQRNTPVQVSGLSSVTAIAAGDVHTVVLRSDGTVWAWGWNGYGQLGDGTATQRNTPVQVSGLSSVTAITAGYAHSVALKSDGTAWSWGWNGYGQLGDGTATQRNTPVQVSGLSSVTAIAAGDRHTVALRSDGTVWAWGDNSYGQLGDGTATQRNTPVQVSGLDSVTAISAGAYHAVALKSDGTVWAWGYNGNGRLGDGTTTNRNTPVQASGLSSVTGIAAGEYSTVALKSDGTVWACGYNYYGQLGDGTTTDRNTPVQVSGLNLFAYTGNFILSISNSGTGIGSVTSSPSGISCGSTCSASYSSGTNVTLSATAGPGSTFTGWSGACSSQAGSATCVVTMSAAEAVTAHYVIAGTTPFSDILSTSAYESYIEGIYNNGITTGCGNGDYCPSEAVTRDQMAAFIIRALCGENVTYTQIPYFSDIQATDYFFKYIQKLKDMNITTMSGAYLPGEVVTRSQMAAFIVRATQSKAGQDTENFTYTVTPYFSDVPATDTYFKYIQKLKDMNITTLSGTYHPDEDVTRDQMAAFIARAFLGMQ